MRVKTKNDDDQEPKEPTAVGNRSPAYPAFDLREAVSKLEQFFAKCKRYPAALDAAYSALGYSSANGAAKRCLAALRAYGFLEPVPGKDQEFRVSSLGLIIVNQLESDPERQEALRTAAWRPKVYRELLDAYGADIPGDNLLHSFLVKKGFSREAVPAVIGPFRSTFEYADLANAGKVSDEDEHDDHDADERERARERETEQERKRKESEQKGGGMTGVVSFETPQGMEAMPVPLGIGRQMILHFPKDVSEDDLEFFNTFWEAYQKRLKKTIASFVEEKLNANE